MISKNYGTVTPFRFFFSIRVVVFVRIMLKIKLVGINAQMF